jgi:hypothetical protein
MQRDGRQHHTAMVSTSAYLHGLHEAVHCTRELYLAYTAPHSVRHSYSLTAPHGSQRTHVVDVHPLPADSAVHRAHLHVLSRRRGGQGQRRAARTGGDPRDTRQQSALQRTPRAHSGHLHARGGDLANADAAVLLHRRLALACCSRGHTPRHGSKEHTHERMQAAPSCERTHCLRRRLRGSSSTRCTLASRRHCGIGKRGQRSTAPHTTSPHHAHHESCFIMCPNSASHRSCGKSWWPALAMMNASAVCVSSSSAAAAPRSISGAPAQPPPRASCMPRNLCCALVRRSLNFSARRTHARTHEQSDSRLEPPRSAAAPPLDVRRGSLHCVHTMQA